MSSEMTPTQQTDNALVFEELHYRLEGATLLSEASGRFEAGRIHAILGQNGAGKSTLLRCLTKERPASSGRVVLAGHDLQSLSYRELALRRAVLPQNPSLVFAFQVEQLVGLGFDVQHWSSDSRAIAMQAILQACDLVHLAKRDYLSLSGGEQQRAHLARVLAQIWPKNPDASQPFAGKWLFLDEWSDGLDLKHQVRLSALLRQWVKQGLSVVMILHDLNQIMQWADDCLMLKQGRVFTYGSVPEVMTPENIESVLGVSVRVLQSEDSVSTMIFPQLS